MLVPLLLVSLLQGGALPLDRSWELAGEGTRIAPHRGVDAIWVDNGRGIRRDVSLGDGTIEFDVELMSHRSFVYLQFRMESDTEFEEIYFRPHKTGLPDAVQYNPVWRGDSFWQLWHGPDAVASPRFRFGGWTHVRLELQGQRGALFLDGAAKPVMVMNLARPARPGYIALRSFNPDPSLPKGEVAARFANVVVRPNVVTHEFGAPVPDVSHEPGSITRWQISPAFKGGKEPITQLPAELLSTRTQWPSYPVERTGIIAIGRFMDRPRPDGAAIARLAVRSSGSRHNACTWATATT